ncbi:MAG: DUF1822 family protein [Okeania sp. SIO3B5]|uniref:DUF1822 family protein n=1 Tax=Okeania sp. SIO3B5 TaxID=2607811 RepID=UPI0013FFD3D4|nr:DUF1822 family protein [Okeania sp. SIO3B5]NEO56643.1 DUF1822 family protein [Okeania sp. SIO3B5]
MTTIDYQTMNISIPIEAHNYAQQFAAQQPNKEKKTQVYLNTLVVYAVDNFLKMFDIPTDLEASDSWNPVIRHYHNVADLAIVNVGQLECRFVLPEQDEIELPPEVLEDRIGYIFVRLEDSLQSGEILGFLPIDEPDEMPEEVEIDELEDIEVLFECLQRLESANNAFTADGYPVFARVKERLEIEDLTNIIAQLEWIYRTKKNYEWRAAATNLFATYSGSSQRELADNLMGSSREDDDENGDIELSDLAEDLMDKLVEIWEEGNGNF